MNQHIGVIGSLSRRMQAGERLLSAWNVIGDPVLPELLVREGFDTVVLDMQHGAFTVETAIRAIVGVALAGAPAMVRVPVGDYATASRMLDAGAAAVIAPMINTVADARALVSFTKYPPGGQRSWGPHRAVPLSGFATAQDYLSGANGMQLTLPMIETRAALDALDDILAVDGIDGVLIGPADLSIALSNGQLGMDRADVDQALDHILARCKAAGKFATLFCLDGATAKRMLERGFSLCSIATDAMMVQAAARAELRTVR